MKIENQVCTLEQAKKLNELGVVPKSVLFLWLDYSKNPHGPKIVTYDVMDFEEDRSYIYSAFTVAELGVMLPNYYESHKGAMDDTWYCGMLEGGDGEYFAIEKTESEARAAMLIYLLGNHLTTPEEVNQRLNS